MGRRFSRRCVREVSFRRDAGPRCYHPVRLFGLYVGQPKRFPKPLPILLVKFACICGAVIFDQTDFLASKAHLIADVEVRRSC